MFSKALHNRWARLGMGILGVLLMAISINLFVVPHNLYTGGLLGFCQLFRSVLTHKGWVWSRASTSPAFCTCC